MTPEAFHNAALALAGATFDVKWGADRIYSVAGKMFAAAGRVGEDRPRYMFKTSPMAFELLIEAGLAHPAPYLARASWVRLESADALEDEALSAYLAQAHALVVQGLPKAARTKLQSGAAPLT